ncbi:hypothetical protein [Pseudomonas serbica]|uniref:hypothetical protein n=1 Tax=Pseudomonas serbica TaxID=2965074 RepID=UPI00237B6F61|nr:hypothetical protein [Pseudomonas serbica]
MINNFDTADLKKFLSSDDLKQLLAVDSSKAFSELWPDWRSGQREYADSSVGIEKLGVVLLNTPMVDFDEPEESTKVEVVKLYGTHELPFRVIGECYYEDVFGQSSETILKHFATVVEAANYAIAAHQARSFEPARIEEHLQALKAVEGAVRATRRSVKPESDEFSP